MEARRAVDPHAMLLTCMEQKLLFMTRISDLTKEIEVCCQQEDVNLEQLLPERLELMGRVDKCDALLTATLEKLPPEEHRALRAVLRGEAPDPLPGYARELFPLCAQCRALLLSTIEDDNAARKLVQERSRDLQDNLKRLREERVAGSPAAATPMFYTAK